MLHTREYLSANERAVSQIVFISYSSKDRALVSRIANDLRAIGANVWWDKWEMKVGDSLNKKIQEGIGQAGWFCIALSKNSVTSPWVERELTSGMVRELEERRVFVLPLLVEDCEVPLFLRDKIYADFRHSYEQGFAELADRVAPRIDAKICEALLGEDATKIRIAILKAPEQNRSFYTQWMIEKLHSEVSTDRRAAITALHVLAFNNLVPHLLGLAKDSSASVRRQVAFYIGELRAAPGI